MKYLLAIILPTLAFCDSPCEKNMCDDKIFEFLSRRTIKYHRLMKESKSQEDVIIYKAKYESYVEMSYFMITGQEMDYYLN